jgi:hypothetical protein
LIVSLVLRVPLIPGNSENQNDDGDLFGVELKRFSRIGFDVHSCLIEKGQAMVKGLVESVLSLRTLDGLIFNHLG